MGDVSLLLEVAKDFHTKIHSKWRGIIGEAVYMEIKDYVQEVYESEGRIYEHSIISTMFIDSKFKEFVEKRFKLNYNRKKFYEKFHLPVKNGRQKFSCSLLYLDSWALFIGYDSFYNYLNSTSTLSDEVKGLQKELFSESKTDINKKIKLDSFSYEVPNHLKGIYEGYFLRPVDESSNEQSITKLYLLITETNEVYVKTTRSLSIDSENKYYAGTCSLPNQSTLNLNFSLNKTTEASQAHKAENSTSFTSNYPFLFVFDIATRISDTNFDRLLKGIYGGSDPTNRKPIAGRMIVKQVKNLDELEKSERVDFNKFLSSKTYTPKELTDDEVFDLFKEVEFYNFFTSEKRYLENIGIIDNYRTPYEKISNLVGEYSIYSLHSTGEYISRACCKIEKTGEVTVNGSHYDYNKPNNFKTFKGRARILPNNIVQIDLFKGDVNNVDESIVYLLKYDRGDQDSTGYKIPLYNGVKIMVTSTDDKKPFSGRVFFVREEMGFFSNNQSLQKIYLFNDRVNELELLENFKIKYPVIYHYLTGFENNVVKTLSWERVSTNMFRDVDYILLFINSAKHYAKEEKWDHALLCINFAELHGFKETETLLATPYFEKFPNNKDLILEEYLISKKDKAKRIKIDIIRSIKKTLQGENAKNNLFKKG